MTLFHPRSLHSSDYWTAQREDADNLGKGEPQTARKEPNADDWDDVSSDGTETDPE